MTISKVILQPSYVKSTERELMDYKELEASILLLNQLEVLERYRKHNDPIVTFLDVVVEPTIWSNEVYITPRWGNISKNGLRFNSEGKLHCVELKYNYREDRKLSFGLSLDDELLQKLGLRSSTLCYDISFYTKNGFLHNFLTSLRSFG